MATELAPRPCICLGSVTSRRGAWWGVAFIAKLAVGVLLAFSELVTNIVPAVLALTSPGPEGAHAWTVIEDLADEALVISIAVFSVAATVAEVGWVRAAGLVVAAIALLRVVLTLFSVSALDVLAPVGFLILILILSVRSLMGRSKPMPTSTAYS